MPGVLHDRRRPLVFCVFKLSSRQKCYLHRRAYLRCRSPRALREYRGLYHVLHGRISPLDNIAAEDLKIFANFSRIKRYDQSATKAPLEIILATNPSEGEATALYLNKLLAKPLDVKITRIAVAGIPVGADLEYADDVTLARALKGRQNYE